MSPRQQPEEQRRQPDRADEDDRRGRRAEPGLACYLFFGLGLGPIKEIQIGAAA